MNHSPVTPAPVWITDLHGIPQSISEERISQALENLQSISTETHRSEKRRTLGKALFMVLHFLLFLTGAAMTNVPSYLTPAGFALMGIAVIGASYWIWKWLLREEGTRAHV